MKMSSFELGTLIVSYNECLNSWHHKVGSVSVFISHGQPSVKISSHGLIKVYQDMGVAPLAKLSCFKEQPHFSLIISEDILALL